MLFFLLLAKMVNGSLFTFASVPPSPWCWNQVQRIHPPCSIKSDNYWVKRRNAISAFFWIRTSDLPEECMIQNSFGDVDHYHYPCYDRYLIIQHIIHFITQYANDIDNPGCTFLSSSLTKEQTKKEWSTRMTQSINPTLITITEITKYQNSDHGR